MESSSNPTDANNSFQFDWSSKESQDSLLKISSPRLDEYKAKPSKDQNKRREEFLQKQKQKRRDLTELARQLVTLENEQPPQTNDFNVTIESHTNVLSADRMDAESSAVKQKHTQNEEKRAAFFKKQFMIPEDMTEIPTDLVENWVVIPVPSDTKRCIVTSLSGQTVSRLQETGSVLHKFSSALPNGHSSQRSAKDYCVLDCLYHESSQIYFVLDLMVWKGHLYYDTEIEFRLFWRSTKLQEINAQNISSNNQHRLIGLPWYPCTKEGLMASVQDVGNLPFNRVGLLFYNKFAHYSIGETSPLVNYVPIDKVEQLINTVFQQ